jgi:MYXO-CTERM domain-containing protein
MPRWNRFALTLLPVLVTAAASVACSESDSHTGFSAEGNPSSRPSPDQNAGEFDDGASTERAIAEADIVQLFAGRLYAMSKSGTLSIVDVSRPGRLTMLGQAYLPGEPFEMYLRGDDLVVMTNGAYAANGQPNAPATDADHGETHGSGATSPSSARDPNSGAGVIVINVKDPGLMQRAATFAVPGEIADSRVVGDVLYLVTYENAYCYGCGTIPRTTVTTFDLNSPRSMRQVDQATFESGEQYDVAWGSPGYKRSVLATTERLYVGGHGTRSTNGAGEGIIDVLDITDPSGKLGKGAHIETTGAILSRWQMDEKDGVLRVVSQRGVGYIANGIGSPDVQTFHIWNTRSMQAMGKTPLKLPRQEGLKSVRFDGDRAYAITFNQTDPLFVIDLADEAAPKQRGELHMPGWVFHLQPHGDRVLGLGLDRNDDRGNLNVSLFDVADMDSPKMLARVAFGSLSHNSDANIVSYELPEDQDRIQKALRVFEDGLVAVPFSGGQLYSNGASGCEGLSGGIQLIDWRSDTLAKLATLPVAGNPRRAILNQGELLAVSDSNVTSFDIARRDVALKTADLVIGSCEVRVNPSARAPREGTDVVGNDTSGAYEDYSWGGCSTGGPARSRGSLWAGLAIAVAAVMVRRRRCDG